MTHTFEILRGNTYINNTRSIRFSPEEVVWRYKNETVADKITSIKKHYGDAEEYSVSTEKGGFRLLFASTGEPIINGILYHDKSKEFR